MLESGRQRCESRKGELKAEFKKVEPHLRDLATQILPRRARWTARDFNKGTRINDNIINNTPLLAARVLSSGMMAAITSPQREWFRLTTPDPEMAQFGPVRQYLNVVQERLRWAFSISAFYQSLADGTYPDIGVFGFHTTLMEEDPRPGRVLKYEVLPIGEYYLATSASGEVDTVYRDSIPMTVRQVVQRFVRQENGGLDWSVASSRVKECYEQGSLEEIIEVNHAIEPNEDYTPGRIGPEGKRWSSRWWEGQDDKGDRWLRVSGYESYPGLSPRWSVTGNETYARCPGMEVLGDCKALQHQEKRLAMLVDKTANPPMKGSESMRGSRATLLPGDITYLPKGQGETFEPAMTVPPGAIEALLMHIQRHEGRIEAGFHADLFLRLVQDERQQRATATEIEELKNETALQLGPVLERLNSELLKPAVDRAYLILDRRGMLPDPPEELSEVELKPEFISIMHEAQKRIGLGGMKVFVSEVGAFISATQRMDVLDKISGDKFIDELGAVTGIKPDMLLSDDEVAQLRAERAAKQKAEDQGAAMLAATQGAKNLATSPAPSQDNALGAVMGSLSPLAGALTGANPMGPNGGIA